LRYLKGETKFEIPYLTYSDLDYRFDDNRLHIEWIGKGYPGGGVILGYAEAGIKKRVKLRAFDESIWIRKEWKDALTRCLMAKVVLGDDFDAFEAEGERFHVIQIPEAILSGPISVSIYTDKGDESNTIEIFISDAARKHFREETKSDPIEIIE